MTNRRPASRRSAIARHTIGKNPTRQSESAPLTHSLKVMGFYAHCIDEGFGGAGQPTLNHRDGIQAPCSAQPRGLVPLLEWISLFRAFVRLDRLETLLNRMG